MNRIRSEKKFIVISILLLFLSTFFNIGGKLSGQEWFQNFDLWSNGIMIADMNYRENYGGDSYFQKIIVPGMVMEDGQKINSTDDIYNKFIDGESFGKNDYVSYCSSITIHRYIYSFINKILPLSPKTTINFIYIVNALLLSISLAIIINWLSKYTNYIVGYVLVIMLTLFAPTISMYGVNLYWASWNLFLPICGSIMLLESKYFKKDKKTYILMFIISFTTCLIKQLFYFEFVSTVMIAMMIPYILKCLDEKYNIRETIKVFIYPTIGAICSFIVVSLIKFTMLIGEYKSIDVAKSVFMDAISRRMTGGENSMDPTIVEGVQSSYIEVFKIMSKYSAFALKNVFSITYIGIIALFVIMFIFAFIMYRRTNINVIKANKIKSLGITTSISLLAPISWFILAKPHTYVHNLHCTITWFIPFVILVMAFTVYVITDFIEVKYELKVDE